MKPSNLVTVKSVKMSPAERQALSQQFDLATQETRGEQRSKASLRPTPPRAATVPSERK